MIVFGVIILAVIVVAGSPYDILFTSKESEEDLEDKD